MLVGAEVWMGLKREFSSQAVVIYKCSNEDQQLLFAFLDGSRFIFLYKEGNKCGRGESIKEKDAAVFS